jgi:transcriptional regulator of acetoin/glycerol metabolism
MHLECALPAGSDIKGHMQHLNRVWLAALSGEQPSAPPRRVIAESWLRSRCYGVDPDVGPEIRYAPTEEIEHERHESRLGQVMDVLRAGLTAVADHGVHIMVITNAKGHILWREGPAAVLSQAEWMGFAEGARWDEAAVGTNGIGVGLAVGHPVQIFGPEHFVRTHHPWVCTAAPLRDPVDGKLLGLVDVSGPVATAHPSTLALVDSVTQLAQTSLRETHAAALRKLRVVASPALAKIGSPALVTDRHGWVAAATEVWPDERVILPESQEDDIVFVPSMGRCRIEPLFDGWLIRQERLSDQDRPTTLHLELNKHTRLLTVTTVSESWRHQLSPRHAEILLALALAPSGRSAAELSQDLYGDRDHTVTVRAEMSRLRRSLGALIEQRPYRLPTWLQVTYELPDDPLTVLPQSLTLALRGRRR